jgi:hypothetical protein
MAPALRMGRTPFVEVMISSGAAWLSSRGPSVPVRATCRLLSEGWTWRFTSRTPHRSLAPDILLGLRHDATPERPPVREPRAPRTGAPRGETDGSETNRVACPALQSFVGQRAGRTPRNSPTTSRTETGPAQRRLPVGALRVRPMRRFGQRAWSRDRTLPPPVVSGRVEPVAWFGATAGGLPLRSCSRPSPGRRGPGAECGHLS